MNGGIRMCGLAGAGLVGLVAAIANVSPAQGQNYQWARTVSIYYLSDGTPTTFNSAQSVTVDPSGNVWATDGNHGRLVKFDGNGNWLGTFGNFYETDGLHSDAAGNIWVAGGSLSIGGCVTEFSSNGAVATQLTNSNYPLPNYHVLTYPSDVAVDPSGNIWVTEYQNSYYSLDKFSSSGALLTQYTPSMLNLSSSWGSCYGVAIDKSGNIWVSAGDEGKIVELSNIGTVLLQVGSPGGGNGDLLGNEGLTFDSAGNLWVADGGNNRIEEFSSGGAYLGQFGSLGTGPGQFNDPQGVAFDAAGNLWVADTNNNRLQEFSPVPEPSTLVLLAAGAASLLVYAWRRRK
jgi:sugar lactone lactonase YvrE